MGSDPKKHPKKEFFTMRKSSNVATAEIVALLMALGWIIFSIYLFLTGGLNADGNIIVQILVMFMPFAMICLCLITVRTSRILQEESNLLKVTMDSLRKAYTDQQNIHGHVKPEGLILRRLDELAEIQQKIQAALTIINKERAAERQITNVVSGQSNHSSIWMDQPSLELGTQEIDLQVPLSINDFIAALNFPETTEDLAGFTSLKRGLKDRETAALIQASQDVLTLLSQDGIYVDDLKLDMAQSEPWRRFAKGERGSKVAALGGIKDRSSLALTNGRMKQDSVFRDTCHHFLRTFDKVFSNFEARATNSEICAFAETRTARAFMLVGRVTGTFD